jgi:four helix bundle protein
MEEKKNDLCERLFEFAVRVIEFLKTLPYSPENKTIRTQLSKSACSSGANYEESQGGELNLLPPEIKKLSDIWLKLKEYTNNRFKL